MLGATAAQPPPRMDFIIPADHPSLPGHFPGRPLVPGVVVLERVVEAIEATHGPLRPLRLPQVKFLQPLLPGERACIELARIEPDGAAPRWRFRVLRGATLISSGDIIEQDAVDQDAAP
jgi:3-hydroxyacyl-[acyl-carrier-protein] dehydratase